ncbi:MAG TPA: tetratricopeptide repeat protein, partial [Gemmatimonadaceae bacterium]|nr:tetratricopeptide repeat protein [Gemmatimonadaceae bacterium]
MIAARRSRIAPIALVLLASVAGAQQATRAPAGVGSALAAAEAAWTAGDTARAARGYEQVLAADPENGRALYRLAQLRRARPAQAELLLRRYVRVEPRDAWGHLALGDLLARTGRVDAALHTYASAERLAPAERDVHVGRARLLARAGRTDLAIRAYESWVARTPDDAEAWRELARERRRAGRHRESLDAARRAHRLDGSEATAAAVSASALAVAPAVELRAGAGRDSDANATARATVTAELPVIHRERLSIGAGTREVSRDPERASLQELLVGARFRPRATTRLELMGGLARHDGQPMVGRGNRLVETTTTDAVGRARVLWREPSDAVRLDVRAQRLLLDATPELLRLSALRSEVGAEVDVRIAGPLRARALGRVGAVRTAPQSNRRTQLGGALVFAGDRGELSGRVTQLRYADSTTAGYFAFRSADLAEAASYVELETESGVTLALDLGAGAQRIRRFDGSGGDWGPALRGWAQLLVPIGRATFG